MKKYIYLITSLLLITFIYFGCEDKKDLTGPAPNLGAVDFTNFVSIGNSITAGYQSGSLYESAQKYAFGNLIAQQVGAKYEIPWYSDPGTPGRMEVSQLTTTGIVIKYNTGSGAPKNLTYPAPYNNLGVPGALLYDALFAKDSLTSYTATLPPPYKSYNPMFSLILRGIGTAVEQARTLKATFITLWIGNNDILGHATTGGTLPYTDVATFTGLYSNLINALVATEAKVVVANIPDVTAIPFFTTVGGQLRLAGTSTVWGIKSTGDTVPMNLAYNLLTLKASELLLQGKGTSKTNPLPNSVILDSAETANVKSIISGYNAQIKALAEAKGFAVVDINSIFNDIAKNGRVENGIKFTAAYVSGGLFSLDGVHPTNRGHGIIANEFIKAINSKWGTNIPLVNVALIPGSLVIAKTGPLGLPIFPKGALDNLLF